MKLSALSIALLPLAAFAAPSTNVEAIEPGVLVAFSKITHPDLTDAAFNKWYSEEHIRAFVKSGMTDLVLRYKNLNATAKWPYLALYRLPDVTKFYDPDMLGSIPTNSELLPGKEKGSKGGAYTDIMAFDLSPFKLQQKFDGANVKSGKVKGRGKGLSTALIEPKAGTDADFDEWYRKEHLDMLSKLPGYRRTTRYAKDDAPRMLALHEFDTPGVPAGIGGVLGTKWSQKVLGGAQNKIFDQWSFIEEYGKASEGDAF